MEPDAPPFSTPLLTSLAKRGNFKNYDFHIWHSDSDKIPSNEVIKPFGPIGFDFVTAIARDEV